MDRYKQELKECKKIVRRIKKQNAPSLPNKPKQKQIKNTDKNQ